MLKKGKGTVRSTTEERKKKFSKGKEKEKIER
jgi:hypothetical protein